MTRTDSWWERLLAEFRTLGELVEHPGRLVLTVDGRRVEIVMTEDDWDDLVSITFGNVAPAAADTLELATVTLQHGLPFLVYANYMLYPSSTPEHSYALEETARRILEFRRTDAMRRQEQGGATIGDLHVAATGMPHVTVEWNGSLPAYQVGSKSFVFFRTPRPDAVDPDTGERYDDVIVFWVASEGDKLALVQDETTPFFTTPHFDGHPSVLLRGSRVSEVDRDEIVELVQDAWLAQASRRRGETWLREHQMES